MTRNATVVTVSYMLLAASYVVWNWRAFPNALPNEVADFLAGVFSPLAFLWLVVGYYLQREDLELQRQELRTNNETQAEQQRAMARQADLVAEQVRMLRERAAADLDLAVALEDLSWTKEMVQLKLLNLGANVYALDFEVLMPKGSPLEFQSSPLLSHWQRGGTQVLQILISLEPTLLFLNVSFVRTDGRARRSAYILNCPNRLLTPQGTMDIGSQDSNPWDADEVMFVRNAQP